MRIALWVEAGATASSVATTLDLFRLAQRFQPSGDFTPALFSSRGGPVQLTEAVTVATEARPRPFPPLEALLLPGFFAESPEDIAEALATTWRDAVAVLRTLPAGTLVGASCYGTFALAEAGLLDDRPATTTWWLAQAFRSRYPRVRLDADQALVDGGRVVTAGAMTAHADLALHLLRRLGGTALARQVGAVMLLDGARTSQLPFTSLARRYPDPLVQRAVDWLAAHLAEPITLEALARAVNASPRTLFRRFRGRAGLAPMACLQALRTDRAKELLEATADDFETITARVGYADPATFRRLFKRATSLTPGQYRRRFRG